MERKQQNPSLMVFGTREREENKNHFPSLVNTDERGGKEEIYLYKE